MFITTLRKRRTLMLAALIAALTLVLAACNGEDAAEEPADADPDDAETDDAETGDAEEAVGDGREISIAWINWEENIAVMNLWAEILEEEGFEVTTTQLDVAPAFADVASGASDLFLDMWMPDTHATYDEEYGDQLEQLGVWFDAATLELTVPAYVAEEEGIESLEDLVGNADLFDGQITGIEAGAGMMELLRNEVMPGYGLDDEYELIESSTPAMRADLESATQAEEPIVVTLWTPHPEYGLKDLHRLEDPQGLWGEGEEIRAMGRAGFSEEFPEVAEWIGNWQMSDEELASLNAAIDEAEDDQWRDVARDWIDENRDLVDSWLGR
jgi:glycine betaine/proline transport system substrate-binding protein